MWKRVCRSDEIPANGLKQVAVEGGPPIVIANAGAEFFACQANCPHEAVSLADGVHDGTVLTCLEHLWQFDLRTGAPIGDAEEPVKMYALKQDNGELFVWTGPGPA
jgi:toluene monooxygenase system ferredoxin subunit